MTVVDARSTAPASSVTPDRIFEAPLADLLAELEVELFDSTITDPGFFGAVVQRKNGELLLAMPSGRSELEHDTVARYLIAQAFDIDLPKLPSPLITATAI